MIDSGTQTNTGSDDVFSDAERAFFESGGAKTEGLFEAPKAEPAKTEPAKTPEAAKTPEDEPEPGELHLQDDGRARDAKTGRYVPLPVLKKERDEHRATRKERDELREKWAGVKAKFEMTQQLLAQEDEAEAGKTAGKTAEEDKEPDPEQDIIAHNKWLARQLAKSRETITKTKTETEASLRTERAQREYEADVRRVASKPETADFPDAYNHLMKARAQQLFVASKAFRNEDGSANIEAIRAQLHKEEADIRDGAFAENESPAERIMQFAKLYGYTPKTKAPTTEQKTAQEKTPAQQAVEQIAAGQEAARTLANAGGGAKAALTLDEYLAMDDVVIAKRMREEPAFRAQVNALHGRR